MKLARFTLLSLAFILLLGLAAQAQRGPLVGVVADSHFSSRDWDRLEYLFESRARRSHFEIDFRYSNRRSSRFGSFGRFSGQSHNRDWDYSVHLDYREGYYDRCGRYRDHYEWYVVDPYDRVIKRGHHHKFEGVAKNAVKAIYKDWR